MPGDNYRYDLRSTAVDAKRDRDTKRKWGAKALNGQREGRSPTPGSYRARPYKERQTSSGPKVASKRSTETQHRYAARTLKGCNVPGNAAEHTGDSSGSGDSSDLWSEENVPEDDGEVMYSYDAQKGPASGQEIFGSAVGQAMTKFEDGVTSRLVKDEYDVLDDAADEGSDERRGETVEEDFEML